MIINPKRKIALVTSRFLWNCEHLLNLLCGNLNLLYQLRLYQSIVTKGIAPFTRVASSAFVDTKVVFLSLLFLVMYLPFDKGIKSQR